MSSKFFLSAVPILICLVKPGHTDMGSPLSETEPQNELPESTSMCNNIGFSKYNPGNSCREIFEAGGEIAGRNGFYYIQSAGGPQQTYCDMQDEH